MVLLKKGGKGRGRSFRVFHSVPGVSRDVGAGGGDVRMPADCLGSRLVHQRGSLCQGTVTVEVGRDAHFFLQEGVVFFEV